nr:protein-tyrosine phosphatase family protein [Erwinia sp. Ejp617]
MKIEGQSQSSQLTEVIPDNSQEHVIPPGNSFVSRLQTIRNTKKEIHLTLQLPKEEDDRSATLKRVLHDKKGQLKPSDKTDPRYVSEGIEEINRFTNIPSRVETLVDKGLNANYITIGNERVAIASQYPLTGHLEKYLEMIVDQRTPAIVVLASKNEINENNEKHNETRNGMRNYFGCSAEYGKITTTSEKTEVYSLVGGTEVETYNLIIKGHGDDFSVKVYHVTNWPDHGTISPEATKEFADRINKELEMTKAPEMTKGVPVIHCRAGVGRTGVVICALVMGENVSVEKAIVSCRECRNCHMVQNDVQVNCLIEMAVANGWPVLKEDEPGSKTQQSTPALLKTIQSAEGKSESAVSSQTVYPALKKTLLTAHANHPGGESSSVETKKLLKKSADQVSNRIVFHNNKKFLKLKVLPGNNEMNNELLKIFENRTPVIIYLATEREIISAGKDGEFFLPGVRLFGDIKTDSKESRYNIDPGCDYMKSYNVNITKGETAITVPVIHFYNFKNGEVPKDDELKKLSELTYDVWKHNIIHYKNKKSRALDDPNKLMPIIFRAQGRSAKGLTTALIELEQKDDIKQK